MAEKNADSSGKISKGRQPPGKTLLEPLLEAICVDEASDSPRLVYADALMQSGDEAIHARRVYHHSM